MPSTVKVSTSQATMLKQLAGPLNGEISYPTPKWEKTLQSMVKYRWVEETDTGYKLTDAGRRAGESLAAKEAETGGPRGPHAQTIPAGTLVRGSDPKVAGKLLVVLADKGNTVNLVEVGGGINGKMNAYWRTAPRTLTIVDPKDVLK